MKTNFKVLASIVLASTLVVGHAQTSTTNTSHRAIKATVKSPAKPSMESQIEALRHEMNTQREEMNSQIQSLKQLLLDRDAQAQLAQRSASAAQAAATETQQATSAQQTALADTTLAVNSLQNSVTDLKQSTQSLVSTVQEQARVKKQIETPDSIHYKGITLSPQGSYIEAATVYRNRALGADINTPFNSIPYEGSDNTKLSEFFGSGRQSRLALLAVGNLDHWTVRGYYEMDWLGTGVTSNNNQSNSYVMRQRQLWAQAESQHGWIFTAGQQWTLAAQNHTGIVNLTELLPQAIDAQYNVGFVWARQYGARIVKNFQNGLWAGISVENAQTLAPSCAATGSSLPCPTNELLGSTGSGGGLYNGAGGPGASSSSPLTTYSYNLAPDLLAKVTYEKPKLGHYEVFGIARFFRDRVYPNAAAKTSTGAGAYNDATVGGGIGGSAYVPATKYLDLGISGLWGQGISRYGSSTLPDITFRPDGQIALLHGFSALGTAVVHASPRLDVYFNYGSDYDYRRYFTAADGSTEGYGSPKINDSGCGIELAPGTAPAAGFQPTAAANCGSPTKDIQEGTVGFWYDFYHGPKGRFRQSIQYSYFERHGWSGTGGIPKGNDNVLLTAFRYYLP